MNISIELLQIINHIVVRTEAEIKQILGKDVSLNIQLHNDIPDDEAGRSEKRLRDAVCQVTGITWNEIISHKRFQKICVARNLYCVFARKHFKRSLLKIGNTINRDHTSIIHSCETVQDMVDTQDEQYMQFINLINLQLGTSYYLKRELVTA